MSTLTLSAREFNQDSGRAKKAASEGPVFITDRGQPSHVLLSIEAYRAMAGTRSIVDVLAMPDDGIAFDPPKMALGLRPAELD